jgi:hypothetical protein
LNTFNLVFLSWTYKVAKSISFSLFNTFDLAKTTLQTPTQEGHILNLEVGLQDVYDGVIVDTIPDSVQRAKNFAIDVEAKIAVRPGRAEFK